MSTFPPNSSFDNDRLRDRLTQIGNDLRRAAIDPKTHGTPVAAADLENWYAEINGLIPEIQEMRNDSRSARAKRMGASASESPDIEILYRLRDSIGEYIRK
jgi:hypothetical protein